MSAASGSAAIAALPAPALADRDELVVVREIPFHSLCMHHLLPFHGVRGVQKAGTRTTTSALLGLMRHDARTRQELPSLARG